MPSSFPPLYAWGCRKRARRRRRPRCLLILLMAVALPAGCGDAKMPTQGDIRIDPPLPPRFFEAPAWHPDGEWIAAVHYMNGFNTIWLVQAGTGRTQPLIEGFTTPAWSPDGRTLAMGGGGQIFTVEVTGLDPARIDTTSLRQLTREGPSFFPAWSPDGRWIAYDKDLREIWKMRPDGSEQTKIRADSLLVLRRPAWSPDGDRIVFEHGGGRVATMDVSGDNLVLLAETGAAGSAFQPRFSPDGARIAFINRRPTTMTSREHRPKIWVMDRDGANQRRVTPDDSRDFDWSPDGRRLIFLRSGRNLQVGNGELWLIDIDGTGLRQLTHFGEGQAP